MKELLKKRTKNFAHNCVKMTENFPNNYLGNHIKKQLIKSATSVAANYRATCVAQSKASFVAKLSIVIEEVDEANFWLEFGADESIVEREIAGPLLKESNELTAIFIAARKTANNRK